MNSKQKTNFLSNLGYFYFAFILFILFAIIAAGTYIAYSVEEVGFFRFLLKVGVPIAIIMAGVLKGFFGAIFSRIPEPDGVELKKEDAPEFYKIVEDICEKSGCPTIHSIKIDFESNAYISEQPSLGMIGRYRRYLVIGLPLIIMLTENELKAVIAHECGHLSKSHSKDSVQIYRAKLIWGRISEELKKTEKDRIFLIRIFMQRYIPVLNNIMFHMSKEHEYQADRIAASIVDKESLGNALLKMSIYDTHLRNTLWDEIYKLNTKEDKPPRDLFIRMERALNEPIDGQLIKDITESMLSYSSLPSSTHPSLSERVEALKADTPKFEKAEESGFRRIFKGQADGMLKRFSETWAQDLNESWKNYYEETKERKERLTVLNEKHDENKLSEDEIFERAFLIEGIEGIENALVAFKEIKEVKPDEIYADYNIGRILLKQDNEEGIEVLEKVMDEDAQLIPSSCSDMVYYYCFKGDRDTAAEYYHYAVDFINTDEEVKEERDSLMLTDVFVSHDLGYDTIIKLRERLMGYEEIKKAYVVIKHTKLSEEFPVYVIGVDYGKTSKKRRDEIHEELLESHALPWEFWVADLNEERELGYIIDGVPEGRIV